MASNPIDRQQTLSDYWCFLSYARGSGPELAEKFAEGLTEELRDLKKFPEGLEPVFFDQTEIQPGEPWKERLAWGLRKCRLMVSLLSEHYFASAYCGREFQVFLERQDNYKMQKGLEATPPVIVPIHWVPKELLGKTIPTVANNLQYPTGSYGADYNKYGLRVLVKNGKYKTSLQDFLTELAHYLIKVAEKHELPELGSLRPIAEIPNPFEEAQDNVHASPTDGDIVQFLYVAGNRNELEKLKKELNSYGNLEGLDWKPYYPAGKKAVAHIAQETATMEEFYYEKMPLDQQLVQRLDEADRQGKVVIILLDCWSLHVDRWKNRIAPYDQYIRAHCELLLPWNANDPETGQNAQMLETALKKTFPNRYILGNVGQRATSEKDFRDKLAVVMCEARARVREVRALQRPRIEGNEGSPPGINNSAQGS